MSKHTKNNGSTLTLAADHVSAPEAVQAPVLPSSDRGIVEETKVEEAKVEETKAAQAPLSKRDKYAALARDFTSMDRTMSLPLTVFGNLKLDTDVKPGKDVTKRVFAQLAAEGRGTIKDGATVMDAIGGVILDVADHGQASLSVSKVGKSAISIGSGRDLNLPDGAKQEMAAKIGRDTGFFAIIGVS